MSLGDEKYLSRHAKRVLKTLHKGYSKKLRTHPNDIYEPTAEFVRKKVRRSDAEFKKILAELSPRGLVSHWSRNVTGEGRKVSRAEPTLRIEEEGIAAAERLEAQRRGWALFVFEKVITVILTTIVSAWIIVTYVQKSIEDTPEPPAASQPSTEDTAPP